MQKEKQNEGSVYLRWKDGEQTSHGLIKQRWKSPRLNSPLGSEKLLGFIKGFSRKCDNSNLDWIIVEISAPFGRHTSRKTSADPTVTSLTGWSQTEHCKTSIIIHVPAQVLHVSLHDVNNKHGPPRSARHVTAVLTYFLPCTGVTVSDTSPRRTILTTECICGRRVISMRVIKDLICLHPFVNEPANLFTYRLCLHCRRTAFTSEDNRCKNTRRICDARLWDLHLPKTTKSEVLVLFILWKAHSSCFSNIWDPALNVK